MCYAALQTIGLSWYLVYINYPKSGDGGYPTHQQKGTNMSDTTALGHAPFAALFTRLMAIIDSWLMASARIAIRNGDLPYPGL
jgi:hypothetical protein